MPRRKPARSRGGFFLVVVLVVVAVATLVAYSFTETMLAYDEATHLASDQVQTRAAAESAIEMTRRILAEPAEARDGYGGLLSNPNLFQAISVVGPEETGRAVNFSLLAPAMDETGRLAGVRFGLQNESAKLNLNALIALDKNSDLLMPAMQLVSGGASDAAAPASESAEHVGLAQSLLLALPGMTIDVADAILDWLDEDDEARPFGAESEHYATLPTPYEPKNGPIESVEELLLVRGVTPELLFGVDANRNGVVDAAEQQMGLVDIGSPAALGWAAFLTVHGQEANRRRDGSPRININQDDLELLYDELSGVIDNADYISFIVAYRIAGQRSAGSAAALAAAAGGGAAGASSGGASGAGGAAGGGGSGSSATGAVNANAEPWTADQLEQLDLTGGAGVQFSQLLDLIDATVSVGEGDSAQVFRSPFTADPLQMAAYMPLLMEALTTQSFEKMPGRININECPVELLHGIPGLDPDTAAVIAEARGQVTDSENRLYETWPLVEGLITLETMRAILPLVTAGGDVYRAQVIGYHETSASFTRLEVIVDATGPNPKVVQYRDLSHLGRGFDLSVLGIRHFIPDGN